MPRPAPALLLPLLLLAGAVKACPNVTSLSRALDTALAEYERERAPARPVRVRAAFDLRHASLRQDNVAQVLGDLTLMWDDPRITWNASEWGCENATVSADRLWLPDVELANGVGGSVDAATTARVSSGGRVAWSVRHDAAVPVALDLAAWPADRQYLSLKFSSRALSSEELDFEIYIVKNYALFESGEWDLVSLSMVAEQRGERAVAAFGAWLRRRAAAKRAATGALLAAAVALLLTAALLPPLQRPPLCACASFMAAMWMVTALLRLPTSSSTPVALSVLCVVCVAGGAAGAGAALVARVARGASPPPRALRSLASTLSALCRLAPLEESGASTGAWAALAALLDLALRAALLITLFAAVCAYL